MFLGCKLYLIRYNNAMTPSLTSLEQQREQVLEQIRSIDFLYRGTLSRHYLKRRNLGKTLTHGPYFVLQGYLGGKKFSQHIHADDAAAVEKGVDNYKLFRELADRFVTLTEQITRLAKGKTDSKKNSSRRKSPTNDSGKPKPS